MKIVVPGGSGQVGMILSRELGEVVVVSRRGPVGWDQLARVVDGADAVVNLAGRSVNCRYNAENRAAIMDSRVQTTHAVGAAIAAATRPPRVWLQASTATIYADTYGPANDENGTLGGHEPDTWRFSIDVARAWEQAALEAQTPATRFVLMRSR